jgi:transposase InsO family protein
MCRQKGKVRAVIKAKRDSDIVVTTVKMNEELAKIYFDPRDSGSLGGHRRLLKRAKELGLTASSENVKDWLRQQYVYTLHHPFRRNFIRNKTIVTSPNDQVQADLVDLQAFRKDNEGYGYLLTFINSFSRKARAVPLKTKSASEVRDALSQLLQEQPVSCLYTDGGGEFRNRLVASLCKKLGITQFFTNNPDTKAAICERFNRTLRSRMFRLMTHRGNRRYIDSIDDMINAYNTSVHRAIGMAPSDVNDTNTSQVFKRIYKADDIDSLMTRNFRDTPRFKLGNSVRYKYALKPMDKSYYPLFGDQVYRIRRVIKGDRRYLYKLEDYNHKELPRSFYAEELQLISADTLYRIEKVIRRKGNKSLVKFLGYPSDANEWIDTSTICTLSGDNPTVHSQT